MGMLYQPLLHLDLQPKGVDAKGDNGQQEPLDVATEKLSAGAVKGQLVTINEGVLCDSALLHADGPGCAEA
jgi:hypothetical protein